MNSKVLKNIDDIESVNIDVKDRDIFFAKFNKSCLITYFGIMFSVLAMYFALSGEKFTKAFFCLVFSGVCDMFDGKFARTCKRTEEEKAFGIQLDSLADTFCFIATPVVIMFALGFNKWYNVISYILFSICGVSRLGYFNIKADSNKAVKMYSGLPVTSTAIIYPFLGLFCACLKAKVLSMVYFIITLLTSFLFVLNIKIPKLKGKAYIIVPILVFILVLLFFVR